VNVIEDPAERRDVLRKAWSLARRALVVAARPDWEARGVTGRPFGDGWVTSKGTFQKFYGHEELRAWIDSELSVRSVAAAPCVFYVFRDERDALTFRARQVRRTGTPRVPLSRVLFETHRELLEALTRFFDERGRLPESGELAEGPALVEAFGSLKAAFGVVRRFTEPERWDGARKRAADNLLVYLALAAFGGRPRMSDLPNDLQWDVKTLFGSYKSATAQADRLLFSAGRGEELNAAVASMKVGKVLPDAVYVHTSALSTLPAVLRVYEGCAQALVGTVDDTTLVKLNRIERKVAYLSYPDFDRDPHPALATSLRADLRSFDVRWRDFRDSANPPVLHRKETFVAEDYPGRMKFARLTAQEVRAGLLGGPGTGTKAGWSELLEVEGFRLAGHRLVRA
jgi:DNA phosphorothioation-associated putative methyltransferase